MRRGIPSFLLIMTILIGVAACKKGPSQQELFDRAKKFQEESNFDGAIAAYSEIVERFPTSAQAPQCQFMMGYLYANHLKNIEKAREAYHTFVRNWPEHELVKDAQWELDHLGKDVNEIEELNRILGKDSTVVRDETTG